MFYITSPCFSFVIRKGNYLVGFGSCQTKINDFFFFRNLVLVSEFFLGGKTIEGFPEELSGFMSSDEFNKALFLLLDKNFLLTNGIGQSHFRIH